MNWNFWRIALAVILAGVGVRAADAPALRASKPAVKAEIVASIEGQLAAFRAGKIEQAYAYASTRLQVQTPIRRFMQVVRAGYPEIWTNTRAEFGLARDDGQRATITARIFANDGSSAAYDYVLAKEDDFWRIAGVLRHEERGETRL